MGTVHVEESGLNDLKTAMAEAGENYKTNLAKLQNLINEITSGDIKGDPATDLKNKFEAKEATFKALASTIDQAEEDMGMQTTKFTSMISNLSSTMQ